MDDKLEIFLVIFIIMFVIVLVSLFLLFFNYRRNLSQGRKAKKELEGTKKEYDSLLDKHTTLQSTYDILYNQYLDLEKDKERLYKLAYFDELTGINNKYFLAEQIEGIFSTLRKNEKFALLYIDIDDFKNITSVIGHSYGDELILDVSHRLKEALDENDLLVRNISDEFMVLCQNFENMDTFEEKVKKIFKVFSYPFNVNSKDISVTISMGIVIAPDYAKSATMLFDKANLAMYEAKGLGKNTYHYYSEQIGEKISNEVLMQSKLDKAIANEELMLYTQPVFANRSEEILSYEALVRWKEPEEGILLPEKFLDLAYSTGQIADIDTRMLEMVCQLQKNNDNKGKKSLTYSVNTSFATLTANGAMENLYETVKKYHADPTRIILEINESELDIAKYREIYDQINSIGFKICVDDFGKDSASINDICSLPIYMVKLDGNIINDAVFEEGAQVMLSSIIDVCNNLKILCVIKGVEQDEQLKYINTLKCDGVQGFALEGPKVTR